MKIDNSTSVNFTFKSLKKQKTGKSIQIPDAFNYIGVFLTFRCPYHCSYCINRFGINPKLPDQTISGTEWIDFFNRLETRDIPITLQGGEPSSHPDFIDIIKETSKTHSVDILTTLPFDIRKFVKEIDPEKLNRNAPYAPIRVTYHPEQFSLELLIKKAKFLQDAGFRIGIYGIMHPSQTAKIKYARHICSELGMDFRTKSFLGFYNGKLYGQYAYKDACTLKIPKTCQCAPSELLIAPDGFIYPCHHHLYNQVDPAGHIHQKDLLITDEYRKCNYYGHCNPCDIKIKNNRFQQFGHISVKIQFP
jgi:MoaA/NifB/PqqE/SkfB family radical SAM enzyme